MFLLVVVHIGAALNIGLSPPSMIYTALLGLGNDVTPNKSRQAPDGVAYIAARVSSSAFFALIDY